MKLLVRNHPTEVWFLTGYDARDVIDVAHDGVTLPDGSPWLTDDACFCTGSFGYDGHCWYTIKDFEEDYEESFGKLINCPHSQKPHHGLIAEMVQLMRNCGIKVESGYDFKNFIEDFAHDSEVHDACVAAGLFKE